MIPPDGDAVTINALFYRRLAAGKKRVAVAEPDDDHALRLHYRDQIVEQRQMKTPRTAGIKFRLESVDARQLREHEQVECFGEADVAMRRRAAMQINRGIREAKLCCPATGTAKVRPCRTTLFVPVAGRQVRCRVTGGIGCPGWIMCRQSIPS